jgi:hypothetical protein
MRGRGNRCGQAGGCETSVETCRVDPSSSRSISPVTCCIRADLPVMDTGDVRKGGKTISVELEAVR